MGMPTLTFKNIKYSYVLIDNEPIPYKINEDIYADYKLDDEMQEEFDAQLDAYEATLDEDEMKVWLGEAT